MSDIFNLLHTLAATRGTGDKPFRRRVRSEDKSHKATITLHKTPLSLTYGVLLEAALTGGGNVSVTTPIGELPVRELDGIDTAAALLGTDMPAQLRKELEAVQALAEQGAADIEQQLADAVSIRTDKERKERKEAAEKSTAAEQRANAEPVKPESKSELKTNGKPESKSELKTNGKPVASGK